MSKVEYCVDKRAQIKIILLSLEDWMSAGTLKLCLAGVTLPPAAGIGLFSLVRLLLWKNFSEMAVCVLFLMISRIFVWFP